jgi:nucleotidyltransferase-like protein
MIAHLIQAELEALKTTAPATLLYGSYARGDHSCDSDIDVLQIVPAPRPFQKIGSIGVSFYTARQLSKLANQGSLFVLHLRKEGVVLHDPQKILRAALDCYVDPEDYNELRSTISASGAVLHLDRDCLSDQQFTGVINLSLYLLRTGVYLRCAEEGTPVFSLRAARAILGDHPAVALLMNRRKLLEYPTSFELVEVLQLLESLLSCRIHPLGSKLEAVAVNAASRSKQAGQLVTRILLGNANVRYEVLIEDEL